MRFQRGGPDNVGRYSTLMPLRVRSQARRPAIQAVGGLDFGTESDA
jgi:hypothetical protein